MSRDNAREELVHQDTDTETIGNNDEQRVLTIPVTKFKERIQRAKRSVMKQYGDLSPEEIAKLREAVEQYQGEIENLRRNEAEMEARSRKLCQDVDELRYSKEKELIRHQLTTEYLQCNGLPEALHDAIGAMMNDGQQFSQAENNMITFRDSEKNDLTTKEYVEMFLSKRPYFRRSLSTKGSGISAVGTSNSGLRKYDSRERRLEAARNIIRE